MMNKLELACLSMIKSAIGNTNLACQVEISRPIVKVNDPLHSPLHNLLEQRYLEAATSSLGVFDED